MEYRRLYFAKDFPVNEELLKTFYIDMKQKLANQELSVEEIEEDLSIDMQYLEEHLEEVDRAGIDHLRCALSRVLEEEKGTAQKVYIKIFGFPDPIPFSSLGHAMEGKVFSLAGVIARIESPKPIAETLIFACNKCRAEIECKLKNGVFDKPRTCDLPCTSKSFTLLQESKDNGFIDYQRIRLHEICLVEEKEKRKPGTVQCILHRSLTNTLLPGDAIHILGTGIAEESEANRYTLAVEINNYAFLKQRDSLQESNFYVPEDIDEIKNLSASQDILHLLSSTLFQGIVGNEKVKEGVILSLIGGSAQKKNRRKEIHALLVGDPGMGKSKLLRIASTILSRSNYVCGATSTTGGLGVSIHSKPDGEYALEAGALVLSDLGHCFIDELDKLDSAQVLFEAMERQQISIAKAGMLCTMPCRAAVIAAANPLFGKYDSEKSLSTNINFPDAFLSRFDLVFLMIENSEDAANADIATHILSLTKEKAAQPRLSAEQAKKYIQYARDQVHPILSASAKSLLIEFYTEIKEKGTYNHRATVQEPTPRILESLIRVAEAKAKSNLRVITTKADIEYAIEMCTVDRKVKHKPGKRKTTPAVQLIDALKQLNQSHITQKEIYQQSEQLGLTKEQADQQIDRLNNVGILIKKSANEYRLRT